jgi:thiol:disulfide interchange protein
MDTPIPMRIFGYVVVIFGLCVLGAAVFLLAISSERTLTLVLVVALEVIAGLASAGWGIHLVRSDTA